MILALAMNPDGSARYSEECGYFTHVQDSNRVHDFYKLIVTPHRKILSPRYPQPVDKRHILVTFLRPYQACGQIVHKFHARGEHIPLTPYLWSWYLAFLVRFHRGERATDKVGTSWVAVRPFRLGKLG